MKRNDMGLLQEVNHILCNPMYKDKTARKEAVELMHLCYPDIFPQSEPPQYIGGVYKIKEGDLKKRS